MNKRIEELAKQAYLEGGDEVRTGRKTSMEKFAKLIVKECAEICTDPYHLGDAGTGDGFGITAADKRCAELIKKYFGVE